MLQAGYDYSRFPDHKESFENRTKLRKVKRTYKQVNTERKIIVKIGASIFAYGLLLVFLCIKSSTLGYQIVELENEINRIDTANYRISYAISERSSLDRIEHIAINEMGMVKPGINTQVAIALEPEPISVVDIETTNSTVGEKPLDKIVNTLLLLAHNN